MIICIHILNVVAATELQACKSPFGGVKFLYYG